MKTVFMIIALFSSMVLAQTTPTDPATPTLPIFSSLKDAMKDMSTKLKEIAKQVADPALNASSEKLAIDFTLSVTAAKAFVPDTVTDAAGKALYEKMMDGTIILGQQLAQAFHDNDNAKATDVLNQLSAAKKEGHTEFK